MSEEMRNALKQARGILSVIHDRMGLINEDHLEAEALRAIDYLDEVSTALANRPSVSVWKSGGEIAEAAKAKHEELSHKGWDFRSFYNGFLEGATSSPLPRQESTDETGDLREVRSEILADNSGHEKGDVQGLSESTPAVTVGVPSVPDMAEEISRFDISDSGGSSPCYLTGSESLDLAKRIALLTASQGEGKPFVTVGTCEPGKTLFRKEVTFNDALRVGPLFQGTIPTPTDNAKVREDAIFFEVATSRDNLVKALERIANLGEKITSAYVADFPGTASRIARRALAALGYGGGV